MKRVCAMLMTLMLICALFSACRSAARLSTGEVSALVLSRQNVGDQVIAALGDDKLVTSVREYNRLTDEYRIYFTGKAMEAVITMTRPRGDTTPMPDSLAQLKNDHQRMVRAIAQHCLYRDPWALIMCDPILTPYLEGKGSGTWAHRLQRMSAEDAKAFQSYLKLCDSLITIDDTYATKTVTGKISYREPVQSHYIDALENGAFAAEISRYNEALCSLNSALTHSALYEIIDVLELTDDSGTPLSADCPEVDQIPTDLFTLADSIAGCCLYPDGRERLEKLSALSSIPEPAGGWYEAVTTNAVEEDVLSTFFALCNSLNAVIKS